MNTILRSILIAVVAVFLGLLLGGILNMLIILSSGYVIPLPKGVDSNSVASIRENIQLFQAKHYVMPFLAHSLGTLFGAFIAASLAYALDKPRKTWMIAALAIGIIFLASGIQTSIDINAPLTPTLVDTIFAYIPFAALGALPIALKKKDVIDLKY